MKKSYPIVFLLSMLLIASCSKTGDFEMNFTANFNGEPLVLFEEYQMGDLGIKFENLDFYLTDIELEDSDGNTVSLSEVEFIQLNAFDEASAINGFSNIYSDLEAGTYKKLAFTIGVSEDLNAMSPSDFNIDDPLGRSDHYWQSWQSYIFSKTEGNADVEPDGVFDWKFFYHTGADECARRFEIEQDMTIPDEGVYKIELSLDYDEMLKMSDGSYFNIVDFPRNHTIDDLDILIEYVDNYVNALKFKS